jgi:hypothetical protein
MVTVHTLFGLVVGRGPLNDRSIMLLLSICDNMISVAQVSMDDRCMLHPVAASENRC